MKTNIKIELGFLAFVSILSLIFQVHLKSVSTTVKAEEIALKAALPTTQVEITAFNRIRNQVDIPVELYAGPTNMEIKTDNDLMDVLDIQNEDGRLILAYKDKTNKRGSDELIRASSIKIYTNTPIEGIALKYNAELTIKDVLLYSTVVLETSGNSRLRGSVKTIDLTAQTDGNSSISIDGTTQNLEANSAGNSRIDMGNLKSTNAILTSSGNAGGTIFSTETLNAQLSGNSHYNILGKPDKTKIVSNGNSHVDIEE